jgi:hypothetical protein
MISCPFAALHQAAAAAMSCDDGLALRAPPPVRPVWLVLILGTLLWKGCSGLSRRGVHADDAAARLAGGLLNADRRQPDHDVIGGRIGTPIGMLAGTYLAEYGRTTSLPSVVRFINDILLSAPSIVVGLFIYESWWCRWAFLGLGRRGGARRHRDAGGGAHHRGHADAGAQHAARSRRRRSACRARW